MSATEDAPGSSTPTIVGALVVGFGCLVFAGFRFGAPGVLLGLMALTLIGVISAFWSSLRTLLGETRLTGADAYAIGAPRAEEEQKRAVLRALKDLEFERSVGKISEDDYKVLVAGYRKEAKRLLRLLDEASAEQRERAEKVVAARLAELGMTLARAKTEATTGDAASVDSPPDTAAPSEVGDTPKEEDAEEAKVQEPIPPPANDREPAWGPVEAEKKTEEKKVVDEKKVDDDESEKKGETGA
jgi:hypothetical protein